MDDPINYFKVILTSPQVLEFLKAIWEFLNSSFSTALFGAFAGALGAQYIAVRSERKKRILDEIRNTNAAISMAYTIMNIFINAKRQHIRTLKSNYEESHRAFHNHLNNQAPLPQSAHIDLRSLPVLNTPKHKYTALTSARLKLICFQTRVFTRLGLKD